MSADTLAARTTHAIEVKHSRFIAHAAPVATPADAMDVLKDVEVRDATHNCWAWRIGGDYRSSDDGEPAGTAGRPILAAIDGQGFDRVMVVVTRWFGGVKLGAGGLVRAYGGAAASACAWPYVPIIETAGCRHVVSTTSAWCTTCSRLRRHRLEEGSTRRAR